MELTYSSTGPIFDGNALAIIKQITDDATDQLAQEAFNLVKQRLGQVLKHPTGYYESRIVTNVSEAGPVITDGGVIYGPWLEGTGSRNNDSRFKGYNTFRSVAQALNADAEVILDRAVTANIGRLQ